MHLVPPDGEAVHREEMYPDVLVTLIAPMDGQPAAADVRCHADEEDALAALAPDARGVARESRVDHA